MKPRTSLGFLTLGACWLVGTAAGTSAAGFGTESGLSVVSKFFHETANDAIRGDLSVGEFIGSFLDGFTMQDVTIRGEDGVVFAEIESVQLGYGLRDILGGRRVFGKLELNSPKITLVQPRGRPFNVDEIFGGDGDEETESDSTDDGQRRLVAFRDVVIRDCDITLLTPVDSSRAHEVAVRDGEDGYMRERYFLNIDAQMPYVRVSSPQPDESGVRFDIASISASLSDPLIELQGARGRVEIRNDSVSLDLENVLMPDTRADVVGIIDLSGEGEQYDLEVNAHGVSTDQIQSLVDELPDGMIGRGTFSIRTYPNVVEFNGRRVSFDGLGGGGSARGNLGMVVGPGSHWGFVETGLDLDNFDLEYVRAYFDTLPFAGRVTGRFDANGPKDQMTIGLDILLRDSLVEGWPETIFDGVGTVSLGGPEEILFQDYLVHHADFDLGTVQRILRNVQLNGRMSGAGILDGPWLQVAFDGDMTHIDNPEHVTNAHGTVRIDARRDTLGVWSNLRFDSLALDGIRPSYPGIQIGGDFFGYIRTDGYMDSLAVDARVEGPGGAIFVDGAVALLSGRHAAYGIDLRISRLSLDGLYPALPRTDLYGRIQGTWVDDSIRGKSASAVAVLRESSAEGVVLDSVYCRLTVADNMVRFDSANVWGRELEVGIAGGIGFGGSTSGTIVASGRVDSLGVMEPFLETLFGPIPDDRANTFRRPSGSLDASLSVAGSMEDHNASLTFSGLRLRRGDVSIDSVNGVGEWWNATRQLEFDVRLNTFDFGRWDFADSELELSGPTDSLRWHGRTRFGADGWGAAIGWGSLIDHGERRAMPIDSLGFQLPSGAWFADLPAIVEFSDSGIDFVRAKVNQRIGAGTFTIGGRLPFMGPGDVSASLRAIPMEDLWSLLQRDYRDVAGELGGHFTLEGTARAPAMVLALSLNQGRFGDFRAPLMQGTLHYRDQRVRGDVSLIRTSIEVMSVDVELPVDLGLRDVERRQLPGAIRINAVADSADLTFMDAVNPLVRNTSGTLVANFGIGGSWGDPELEGTVSIINGSVHYPALGVRHRDINGSFTMSGDTILIDQFSMSSGEGDVDVSGFVRMEELTRPILDLHVEADNFFGARVPDFVSVTATGVAELHGPLFGATMTGAGTVTEGVLYFADIVEKEVYDFEDPRLLEIDGFTGAETGALVDTALIRREGLGVEFENRFLDSLRIDDLTLIMGSDVWMRSNEANIQLLGTIRLNKVRDEYSFDGTLETPRGTYTLSPGTELVQLVSSHDFDVTSGEVTYYGTTDLNSGLDINARHRLRTNRGEDMTVFVHIGGTFYEPELTLTSDILPPISDAEILFFLFTGGPGEDFRGTSMQNQLLFEQGISQLLGTISGELGDYAISELGLPFDHFQIRPYVGYQGVWSTEIEVGTRLTDKWFLTVSPHLCPSAIEHNVKLYEKVGASLEYRLGREWRLALSGDPVQSCAGYYHRVLAPYQVGGDIFWQKRY